MFTGIPVELHSYGSLGVAYRRAALEGRAPRRTAGRGALTSVIVGRQLITFSRKLSCTTSTFRVLSQTFDVGPFAVSLARMNTLVTGGGTARYRTNIGAH